MEKGLTFFTEAEAWCCRYWYPCVLLYRNLLFSLVPVAQTLLAQIVCMTFLVLGHLIVAARMKPWRISIANDIDVPGQCVSRDA